MRTPLLAGLAILGLALAAWFYRDNRALADEVARLRSIERQRPDPWTTGAKVDGAKAASEGPRGGGLPLPLRAFTGGGAPPKIDAPPSESRLERRVRRQNELAALLGRDADESEDDYRARMLPFLKMALDKPRANVEEMRQAAEAAAKVTPEQRQQLDAAFDGVYTDLLDYTNAAVADGQLTPYDRNVKGILQYAGGLGAILEGAEGRVGKILSPEQIRAMYDTGFEWGEYVGVRAPWEQLRPPPPRPPGS